MHLIVGADSFIGRNLFDYWVGQGISVKGTSRRLSSDSHLYLDLLDVDQFNIPDFKIDSAVVLAGITDVSHCDLHKKTANKVNVEALKQLIENLAPITDYFLFLSSSLVFDGNKQFYTTEDSVNPSTQYGKNKVCLENFILDNRKGGVLRVDKVLDWTKPLFREWKASLSKQLPVEAYSDLYFSPLEITSVVQQINYLVRHKTAGISHLPGNGLISYYDYVKKIAVELGVSTRLVHPKKSGFQNRAAVCLR